MRQINGARAPRIPCFVFRGGTPQAGVSGLQPDSARNETGATLQDASEKILRMDIFVQTKFNSP
jgi:hypothetical protein